MVTSLSKRAGAERPSQGDAFSCHLDNKKQMSQLNKIALLSQAYSTWPSTLLGSDFCVIFISSPLLGALKTYPHLSLPPLLVFLPFFLSFFVRISPSISVPVLLLAMCGLTDEPLFAVLSYLSGGGAMCLEWLLSSSLWPSERAGSAAGHALAEVDAAYELETSWRSLEALHDPWMNLKNPGTPQRRFGCFLFIYFYSEVCWSVIFNGKKNEDGDNLSE